MRTRVNQLNHYVFIFALLFVLCFGVGSSAPIPSSQKEQEYQAESDISIKDTPIQYHEVNGVRIAYREFGDGEPLLVIVGFGATMEQANDTAIGIFASQYHVYLYDHRGMGHSTGSSGTPTITRYAEDAAHLISALGYESMHVYGTSMGSFIAQELVLNTPEKVDKMILDSSSYSIRVNETQELVTYLDSVLSDPSSPQGLMDEAHALLAWNGTWDRLADIKNDVMLVVGTNDTITPDILSVRMGEQIASSWVIRFRDLPHAGGDVDPVRYGKTALFFLETGSSR